jgi:hypothetical protein
MSPQFTKDYRAIRKTLGVNAAVVYGVIESYSLLRGGWCTLSLSSMAEEACVSSKTIQREIKSLLEAGLIQRREHGSRKTNFTVPYQPVPGAVEELESDLRLRSSSKKDTNPLGIEDGGDVFVTRAYFDEDHNGEGHPVITDEERAEWAEQFDVTSRKKDTSVDSWTKLPETRRECPSGGQEFWLHKTSIWAMYPLDPALKEWVSKPLIDLGIPHPDSYRASRRSEDT